MAPILRGKTVESSYVSWCRGTNFWCADTKILVLGHDQNGTSSFPFFFSFCSLLQTTQRCLPQILLISVNKRAFLSLRIMLLVPSGFMPSQCDIGFQGLKIDEAIALSCVEQRASLPASSPHIPSGSNVSESRFRLPDGQVDN